MKDQLVNDALALATEREALSGPWTLEEPTPDNW